MSSCGVPATCQYGKVDNVTGFCICDPGYTSFADFRFLNNLDCDVYFLAIQILFGISLFIYVSQAARLIFDNIKQIQKKGWRTALNLKLALNQIRFFMGFELLFGIVFCALKVISPVFVIGTDELTTWIHFFLRLSGFMASFGVTGLLYSIEIKAMGLMGKRNIKLEQLYWINVFFSIFTVCAWSLTVISHYVQGFGCQLIQASFYMVIINMYFNSVRKHIEMKPLLQALSPSATPVEGGSEGMARARVKFWRLHRKLVYSASIVATAILVIISVPESFHNLSYYEAAVTLLLCAGNISTVGIVIRTETTSSHSASHDVKGTTDNKGTNNIESSFKYSRMMID